MNFDDFERYDALILDMDGTLIDSGKLHEKAWINALSKYSIPVDRPLMRSLAGVPTHETVEHLQQHFQAALDVDPREVHRLKEEQVHTHLLDYVKPTALEKLVKYFYGKKPMAVGTGATTQSANSLLEACDLGTYIDVVVGADQVDAHKPEPDTFLLCAEKLGVEAKNCVVFEDSPLGLKAAQNAGMAKVDVAKELNITNDYFL